MPEELKKYFWDTKFEELDIRKNKRYIISRLYCYGDLKAIKWIKEKNIEGYIFKNKYGQVISARGISEELKKIAIRLNINIKKVHPHSFRHMFAINFLKNNKDITLLADLLGHSNLDTTKIYLRRTEEEQKEIINSINW